MALLDVSVFGTQGSTPLIFTGQYLIAVEIAPVSETRDLPVAGRLLRAERHRDELCSIIVEIG